MYLVGGFNPSEKYESQVGSLFPIYGNIKFHVPNHQPGMIVYSGNTIQSEKHEMVLPSADASLEAQSGAHAPHSSSARQSPDYPKGYGLDYPIRIEAA